MKGGQRRVGANAPDIKPLGVAHDTFIHQCPEIPVAPESQLDSMTDVLLTFVHTQYQRGMKSKKQDPRP